MKDAIEDIAKVRNDVFHFKRLIAADDVDTLRRFRDRLLQQRQAFNASAVGQGSRVSSKNG